MYRLSGWYIRFHFHGGIRVMRKRDQSAVADILFGSILLSRFHFDYRKTSNHSVGGNNVCGWRLLYGKRSRKSHISSIKSLFGIRFFVLLIIHSWFSLFSKVFRESLFHRPFRSLIWNYCLRKSLAVLWDAWRRGVIFFHWCGESGVRWSVVVCLSKNSFT